MCLDIWVFNADHPSYAVCHCLNRIGMSQMCSNKVPPSLALMDGRSGSLPARCLCREKESVRRRCRLQRGGSSLAPAGRLLHAPAFRSKETYLRSAGALAPLKGQILLLGRTEVPDSVLAAVTAQRVPMVLISSAGNPTPSHRYMPVRTKPEGIIG